MSDADKTDVVHEEDAAADDNDGQIQNLEEVDNAMADEQSQVGTVTMLSSLWISDQSPFQVLQITVEADDLQAEDADS